ncbi:unnamed protein product [Sphagnum balticum]
MLEKRSLLQSSTGQSDVFPGVSSANRKKRESTGGIINQYEAVAARIRTLREGSTEEGRARAQGSGDVRGNGKAGESTENAAVRLEHIEKYSNINTEKTHEQREKYLDTFQGDEFYDCTLEKKEEMNLESIRRE